MVSNDHSWARQIVTKHFEEGLRRLVDPVFVERRFRQFELDDDAVYARLLGAMGDAHLQRTFVSHWKLGQALATQSRAWLDRALADIVIERAKREKRAKTQIYTQQMLGHRWLDRGITVQDIGENWREELTANRPWRQLVHSEALSIIDDLVGHEERERVDREKSRPRMERRSIGLASEARPRSVATRSQCHAGPPGGGYPSLQLVSGRTPASRRKAACLGNPILEHQRSFVSRTTQARAGQSSSCLRLFGPASTTLRS